MSPFKFGELVPPFINLTETKCTPIMLRLGARLNLNVIGAQRVPLGYYLNVIKMYPDNITHTDA